MKYNFLLFNLVFCILSFLFSCNSETTIDNIIDNEDYNKIYINFKNKSSYTVSVYSNHPSYSEEALIEITANSENKIEINHLNEQLKTFYFVYNLDFGVKNVFFPYYPKDDALNHKSIKVDKNGTYDCVIDEIIKCETNSSYIFLENNTTSDIYLLMADGAINPYKANDKFIKQNYTGIYEIGEFGNILPNSVPYIKIVADAEEYTLPQFSNEPGNIYTINVSNSNNSKENKIISSVKSVTPFNIDTVKKMWSFDDSLFICSNETRPMLKESYSLTNGSIIIGKLKKSPDKVGIVKIDEYGNVKNNVYYELGCNIPTIDKVKGSIDNLTVLDGVEQSDSSIILLLRYEYLFKVDDNLYSDFVDVLCCYNYINKSLIWSTELLDYWIEFRKDSKNKLVLLEDNKVILVGTNITFDETNRFVYYQPTVALFDFTQQNKDGSFSLKEKKYVILENKIDNESFFTSAICDNSNIYVCGYVDCDFKYGNVVHKGIVYKFDKSDISIYEQIYEEERCLFFSMEKEVNSDIWYICGEYWSNDGLLRGIITNKKMIDHDIFPIKYGADKKYTWFNQLCAYGNKTIVCGVTSETKDGSDDLYPIVVAFDEDGTCLWENKFFTNYENALNIIPNSIGTYMVQLTKGDNIHYVNADLLGQESK